MKATLYILILITSIPACINKTEKTEIKVEDVHLEQVVEDSNELKEPPIPLPPSNSKEKQICNCEVLMDVENKKEVLLFDHPAGHVIKKLKHNFEADDYLIATIEQDSADFFYVHIRYSIADNSFDGWVKKTEPIGVYARNYAKPLKLYSFPNKSLKITAILSWNPELYRVTSCSGKWLYVNTKVGDKIKMGWLSPEMQCANQYTTCN